MGELGIGDQVFDERGRVCSVIAATPVMQDRPCYRVAFCDGSTLIADASHQWLTFSNADRAAIARRSVEYRVKRREQRPRRGKGKRPDLAAMNAARTQNYLAAPTGSIATTDEIARTLMVGRRTNHSIAVCGGLELPAANLLIPPYVLGVWLGDGTRGQGAITTADAQIIDEVERRGFTVRKRPASRYGYGVLGLHEMLKKLGVDRQKTIPPEYLRASREQRMELLRGLMDTDGHATKARGSCEFDNTNRPLIEGVAELLASLGIKAAISEGRATLNGHDCGPKYRLKFTTSKPVFCLKRKLARLPTVERGTQRWRMVKSVERIESVPVRCIEVDSPSHLFLAGREMIPTHNSHLMRIGAVTWCTDIPGLQVYIFRRVSDDLVRNHMDGPKGFRALLAPWVALGWVKIIEDEIRFWNGSKIHLCHCKDEKHVYKYHGAEIHVLIIDELTTFTEFMYRYLRNRLRMVGIKLPPQYEGRFPRILCGSNPGNTGHLWVKRTFIEGSPPYKIRLMGRDEGGMTRQYIRATLEDNPSMESDDPGYELRLEGLGSKTLVAAMRWGDWDIIEGAFFDCWENRLHVVAPFSIPRDWLRFRSGDWGSATPFSIGWWAVVQDDFTIEGGTDFSDRLAPRRNDADRRDDVIPQRTLPRGCLVRYREWYGKSADNVGLKLTAEQVGDGILEREVADPKIAYAVLDPSAFKVESGPSIAERLNSRLIKAGHAAFHEADNKRTSQASAGPNKPKGPISGWDQVRARMIGELDPTNGKALERPLIVCFSTCLDSIRTIPVLQHDTKRPEDLDTNTEDHAADDWRYACMSRPYRKTPLAPAPPKDGYQMPSNEIPDANFKIM